MKIAVCKSESGYDYIFKCDSSVSNKDFFQKILTYADWEAEEDDFGKISYMNLVDIVDLKNIEDVSQVIPDFSIKRL